MFKITSLLLLGFTVSTFGLSYSYSDDELNLDDLIEYHEGLPFPAKELINFAQDNYSSSNVCDPYESKSIFDQASIDIRTKKKEKARASYTALPFWGIEQVYRDVHESKHFYKGWTELFQPNQHTLVRSQYQQVYNSVHNFLMNLDIPKDKKLKIDAQLRSMVNSYETYSYHVRSTHSQVLHNGEAGRKGIFRKKSVYKADLDITLICLPAEVTSVYAAESTFKAWVRVAANR